MNITIRSFESIATTNLSVLVSGKFGGLQQAITGDEYLEHLCMRVRAPNHLDQDTLLGATILHSVDGATCDDIFSAPVREARDPGPIPVFCNHARCTWRTA